MKQRRTTVPLFIATLLLGSAALWGAYEAIPSAPAALASWAPVGALLAIESPDFSALLHDWEHSEQQRTWLTSDNYSEFSRSRLFSRLGEAQDQFATSAGLPPNQDFLNQMAGKESLFAWYNIGNLEFLYITHMQPGAAEKTPLLQLRGRFEARKLGADSFYVRTEGDPKRTVAFAVHGDYLLLATREDLLAGALSLMQSAGHLNLQEEHWYAAAISSASAHVGDLRMTLNLAAIVKSPYFRSYWVQQNISEMKRYSASVSDLYRTPAAFREERVLLPASDENGPPALDLAPVLTYLPKSAGVYRAIARPTIDQSLRVLDEKLLSRDSAGYRDPHIAPVSDSSTQPVGSASDLETHIDTAPPPQQTKTAAMAPLRTLLDAAHLDAMLVSSSTERSQDHSFLPIHSVVVLSAATPWNADAVESALTEVLRSRLTVRRNGLDWQPRTQGDVSWFELSGLQPLAFALRGRLCVVASDSSTLLQSLARAHAAESPQVATVAAGFDHTVERPQFQELTGHLDQTLSTGGSEAAPAFFSKNIGSISDTFQALDSETFVERPDESARTVHQTVLYQWRH